MLFTKRHYFMLGHTAGFGARRILTRRRRHVLADLVFIAFWLLIAVFVLAMVPVMRNWGGCTTHVVPLLSD